MSTKARRLLVLLLIILKEAGPTADCSSSCSSGGDCSSRGLTSVPQDLPTDIAYLGLQDNAITNLSQSDFSRYRSLVTLHLSSNQISMIHNKTFHPLIKLVNLRLHNNQLSTLPSNIFAGLKNLFNLYLHKNELRSLPSDIFVGHGNLQTLWLSSNKLTSLPTDIFAGLGNLQGLYLDQNQLQTLSPTEYWLPFLASITTVRIDENPWQCDCRMAPFRQRMNGSYPFEGQIRCAGPGNLAGHYLQDINPEDLMCEETTPVYSTSTTKRIVDNTLSLSVVDSSSEADSNAGPTGNGIVLSVPILATLCVCLGIFIICTIACGVWCMYKRRSNATGTGVSSSNNTHNIRLHTVTHADRIRQSETSHSNRQGSQHTYNLPNDDPEYDTIADINQSEGPHQGIGNMQGLNSLGHSVLPPPLRTENPTGPQVGALSESADDYEVPSSSLASENGVHPQAREEPQSHKYVNSQIIAAAAQDALADP